MLIVASSSFFSVVSLLISTVLMFSRKMQYSRVHPRTCWVSRYEGSSFYPSILQPVYQFLYFGYPCLIFADDVLSEIDLKRASFFDDTVLATVSRNSLNNLVFTIVSVLLQSVSRNSLNAVYCWLPLAAAAAHAKYFARTMRGAGRCVEHRREMVISPRCEITRSMQSRGVVL